MSGRLQGLVSVITGGASGIGAATVRRFVAEGAKVVICDIQDAPGEALATELGPSAVFRHTNVALENDVAAAIRTAVNTWGRLDVLFNNAGFGGVSGPLDETSSDEYDNTMDVLLKSVFFGIKHASPIMKQQRSGSIISTASMCAFTAGVGNHLYSVAKAGVVMLTKTAALELAEWGVRVNAVCPGYIATPLAGGVRLAADGQEKTEARVEKSRQRTASNQPLARTGEPEDVAALAVFFASADSQWITGTAQLVDGGIMAGTPWRDQPFYLTQHRPMDGR